MKCIIYARVSTDRQDVTNQLDLCVRWCKDNHPNAKVEIFQDPDTSSKLAIEKRLALSEMLAQIRKGDIVIIFKLDRIARDIVEMVTIYRLIEMKGAKVHSLSEPEISGWMLGIFGALAQKEREDISLRIKAALKVRKERGERVSGLPYGYKVKDSLFRTPKNKGTPLPLVQNPKEIRILREVERLVASGTSWRCMAVLLNELGYRTRRGTPWSHDVLYRMYQHHLRNQKSPESMSDRLESSNLDASNKS